MSAPINKEKVEQEAEQQIHKIRITLTSTKVKQLENVSANIIRNAAQYNIVKKGPVRMPTKVLKITTRKTPNGEGSKTWDAYEMRIHKRVIDLQAPASTVKRITQIRCRCRSHHCCLSILNLTTQSQYSDICCHYENLVDFFILFILFKSIVKGNYVCVFFLLNMSYMH